MERLMDEVQRKFMKLVIFLNNKYNLQITYELVNTRPYTKFFVVRNMAVEKPLPVNAGTYYDVSTWTEDQICRQILACLGLLNKLEEKTKMSVYDQTPSNRAQKEQIGRETAETLLPFLRTDVPLMTIHRLAMMVSTWSGLPDDANFTTGFLSVFMEYKDSNDRKLLIQETTKRVQETFEGEE